ncbi:hypothetical protein SteCoe_2823 [Stentor coeruleus]|uniref:Uncharacterized protein n=1 Tax=Stentor coeruleus TaxID=5963 RepID=A0A1R2CYJ8_9CILI|nr:hypothetical protein SteCoe_2823 [Stentor coeruleus]
MDIDKPSEITDFGIINLTPCGRIKKPRVNSKKHSRLKKPTKSPSKAESTSQETQTSSQSPTKKRTKSNKENIPIKTKSPEKLTKEIPFEFSEKTIQQMISGKHSGKSPKKTSATVNKIEKKFNNQVFGCKLLRNFSHWPNGFETKLVVNAFESPKRPVQAQISFTPDIENRKKPRRTPINVEKIRKIPISDITNYCKRVSLFNTNQNVTKSTQEKTATLIEPVKKEDSSIILQMSPIKTIEDSPMEFPDVSFFSPKQVIHVGSPEKQDFETSLENSKQQFGTYILLTPENINEKKQKIPNKIVKKENEAVGIKENALSMSSSSDQDIISDISLSEYSASVNSNACKMKVSFVEKEMQTESKFVEIFNILKDAKVMIGLKSLGKITEIMTELTT